MTTATEKPCGEEWVGEQNRYPDELNYPEPEELQETELYLLAGHDWLVHGLSRIREGRPEHALRSLKKGVEYLAQAAWVTPEDKRRESLLAACIGGGQEARRRLEADHDSAEQAVEASLAILRRLLDSGATGFVDPQKEDVSDSLSRGAKMATVRSKLAMAHEAIGRVTQDLDRDSEEQIPHIAELHGLEEVLGDVVEDLGRIVHGGEGGE
jgi:hypothetical protein